MRDPEDRIVVDHEIVAPRLLGDELAAPGGLLARQVFLRVGMRRHRWHAAREQASEATASSTRFTTAPANWGSTAITAITNAEMGGQAEPPDDDVVGIDRRNNTSSGRIAPQTRIANRLVATLTGARRRAGAGASRRAAQKWNCDQPTAESTGELGWSDGRAKKNANACWRLPLSSGFAPPRR